MIFTSYFANVKKLPPNVFPVAICIQSPVGYKGPWYPRLAPDYSILRRYKRDNDIKDYTKLFTRSVLDNLDLGTVLNDLNEMTSMFFRPIMCFPIHICPKCGRYMGGLDRYAGNC